MRHPDIAEGENFDGVGSDKDDLNDKDDSENAGFYYHAEVGDIIGDTIHKEFFSSPYYMPYPYDEGSRSTLPKYTREELDEVHVLNIGLLSKMLLKDRQGMKDCY